MSVFEIVAIVLAGVLVVLFLGGVLAARRRAREEGPAYARHLRAADHALEQARAGDRGWDRDAMEVVARAAVERETPGATVDGVELVLVDDQPGVTRDRAHFEVRAGGDTHTVVLTRSESGWSGERAD